MTLTTRVYIKDPTPVRPIFDECRRIIGGQDAFFEHNEPAKYRDDGACEYRNKAWQGLPALLWVYYGLDAPLRPDEEDTEHPYADGYSIEVAFDTAYGYEADNGASCSDLHAWLVFTLGRWLDERRLTWCWQDDTSGVYRHGRSVTGLLGDAFKGRLDTVRSDDWVTV